MSAEGNNSAEILKASKNLSFYLRIRDSKTELRERNACVQSNYLKVPSTQHLQESPMGFAPERLHKLNPAMVYRTKLDEGCGMVKTSHLSVEN